jgi:hypothetical protein
MTNPRSAPKFRLLLGTLALALLVIPFAQAADYTSNITGVELLFGHYKGTFSGTASGAQVGAWRATIHHTLLAPSATIDGGTISFATRFSGSTTVVKGNFSSGTITFISGAGCTTQRYRVDGYLSGLRAGTATGGTGRFTGTLTHYRKSVLGHCLLLSATVRGTLTLHLPS